jgi:cell fate regulator YaaT (PSP1 superfamily)
MVKVVGVRFKNAGKVYYFDPGDLELYDGDKVVVETVRGLEFGEIVGGADMVPEDKITPPLKRVIRKATPDDGARVAANREKEQKAFETALAKIETHGLPMKLVDVEYTFDNSKIIFFFTSESLQFPHHLRLRKRLPLQLWCSLVLSSHPLISPP